MLLKYNLVHLAILLYPHLRCSFTQMRNMHRPSIFWPFFSFFFSPFFFFSCLDFSKVFYCMKHFLLKSSQGHFLAKWGVNMQFKFFYCVLKRFYLPWHLQPVEFGWGGALHSDWNAPDLPPKKTTSNTLHNIGAKRLLLVSLMKCYKNR